MKLRCKKTLLENGLRVIVVPRPESPSVSAGVFVQAGSAYESKKNNGLSHFLEHMCFKGTQTRPSPLALSGELESLGAAYNAFTSFDMTGYYITTAAPHFEKGLELLSDIYLNPLLEEKEVKKERGVIIEELNMYEDDPPSKAHLMLESLMYGDQPAGWGVIGTKKVIRSAVRDDFVLYRDRHYVGCKTIVVIVGGVSVRDAMRAARKHFEFVKKGKKIPSPALSAFSPRLRCVLKHRVLDQTHFVLGIKAFPFASPRNYALSVLSDVIGGGMSSRLFQRVREEMGAAYYINSRPFLYGTHGFLGISGGVTNKKIVPVLEAIRNEIEKVAAQGITRAELTRAKEHIIGTFLLSLETSQSIAFFLGRREAMEDDCLLPRQEIARIRAVTLDDVKCLSKELFEPDNMYLSVVGPHSHAQQFKRVLYR